MAIDLLKPRGSFVCKFYTGTEDAGLEKRLKKVFDKVKRYKPEASRQESKELYFVCQNKKNDIDKMKVFS
jgi:21S rRNA (uridine2791-2'-O)-methyltransferase